MSKQSPASGPGLLVFASFWGRSWLAEEEAEQLASSTAEALRTVALELGGTFVQSTFLTNTAWEDGSVAPVLGVRQIEGALQMMISRGAASAHEGRDDEARCLMIVFPDQSLVLAEGPKQPPGPFVGRFETLTGATCLYGYGAGAARAGAAQDLIGMAKDLLQAMLETPPAAEEWQILEASRGNGPAYAPSIRPMVLESAGLLPLPFPSLHVEERIPGFAIKPDELGSYVMNLTRPLGLDEIPGAAQMLHEAGTLLDHRIAERAVRPYPATGPELRDFSRPNPRITIAERLQSLAIWLGEGHPDVATVGRLLEGVSEDTLADLRRRFYGDGAYGFLDAVYWTYHKLALARRLDLAAAPPRSVLDIGCGGGHFTRVLQRLGHSVVGTDIEHPVYAEIAAALGVERTIHQLLPDHLLPDFGRRFDVVTAVQVEFDHLSWEPHAYWSLDHWKHLFNDLIANQLIFPARIYIYLNFEFHDGKGVFNVDLMRLCESYGAEISEKRGTIDWKMPVAIEIE